MELSTSYTAADIVLAIGSTSATAEYVAKHNIPNSCELQHWTISELPTKLTGGSIGQPRQSDPWCS